MIPSSPPDVHHQGVCAVNHWGPNGAAHEHTGLHCNVQPSPTNNSSDLPACYYASGLKTSLVLPNPLFLATVVLIKRHA